VLCYYRGTLQTGNANVAGVDTQQQFILSLLQDNISDDDLRRLNALGEGEWREVIDAANAQGLAPLLSSCIQRLQISAPQATQAQLREVLLNNTARNLQLLKHFGVLAGALQGQNLPFLPLKGVYLCSNVYENLGERTIWDIDLLVPAAELERALALIEATGYHPSRPYDLQQEVGNYHHVPVYVKAAAPPLEVHWTLLNPRFQHRLDWQQLWERSVPARIGTTNVRVLAPDDLMIYLCAHVAYQHMYIDSIRSLYDLKLVLKSFSRELDWDAISARARTWGLLNSVYLTLHLTDKLLGPILTESIWPTLRPSDFRESLTEAAVTRLVEGARVSPVVNAVWTRRSLIQRIKGLWDRIAVPRSILAGRYGLPPKSRRVYLYYLVRAWDLLRIHGGNLLGLLLGGRRLKEGARRDSELVTYLNWWQ
jgi:hypothetical protein